MWRSRVAVYVMVCVVLAMKACVFSSFLFWRVDVFNEDGLNSTMPITKEKKKVYLFIYFLKEEKCLDNLRGLLLFFLRNSNLNPYTRIF